jgi:hypothetical protein
MNSGTDADRVLESGLVADIRFGEVVNGIDLPGVADANGHAEIAQPHARAAGHEPAQRLDREHRLLAALDLALAETVRIGPVHAGEMDEIHIGELSGIVHRAPGAGDGVDMRGDDPSLDRTLEGFFEEGRKKIILLAGGFDRPFSG